MIAVAGFNASIDKLLLVDDLAPGSVLRARAAQAWPGGKGVHVALGAAALGEKVRLAGLIDTAQREWFRSWLGARGVEFHGIEFSGPVRTCLTIQDSEGRTTEIREPGPAIDGDVWSAAAAAFEALCADSKVAVLSGSVPPGVPVTAYQEIAAGVAPLRVLVDASGELLTNALDANPFCIKPNREEAEALTRSTLDSKGAAAHAARELCRLGVRLVIISLGAAGAVACADDQVYEIASPPVVTRNAVGAGDCLLAGVAVALARDLGIEEALRLGAACGTAKVMSPEIGLVRREDVEAVLPTIRLTRVA